MSSLIVQDLQSKQEIKVFLLVFCSALLWLVTFFYSCKHESFNSNALLLTRLCQCVLVLFWHHTAILSDQLLQRKENPFETEFVHWKFFLAFSQIAKLKLLRKDNFSPIESLLCEEGGGGQCIILGVLSRVQKMARLARKYFGHFAKASFNFM